MSDNQKIALDLIHVKIYSPYIVYYDDNARTLSAENQTGPFDILPGHHKFITLLNPCYMSLVKPDGETISIKIAGGLMYVANNKVTIYLDV